MNVTTQLVSFDEFGADPLEVKDGVETLPQLVANAGTRASTSHLCWKAVLVFAQTTDQLAMS